MLGKTWLGYLKRIQELPQKSWLQLEQSQQQQQQQSIGWEPKE